MRKLLFTACIILGACAGTLQSVEYSCASATALLQTATGLKDKLTDAQKTQITNAVVVITPICSLDKVPTLDSTARAGLASAVTGLALALKGAQK